MKPYHSYRDIPPLAGICSMEEAMKPGLSVDQCVTRLKRYHYAFKRLHHIFMARLTAEPIYELKSAFSLHGHICAEHVSALRQRVSEMREPPLGFDKIPAPELELFFDEILSAEKTVDLLIGIYEKALPALERGLQRHLQDTNRLTDHPSVRICRFALLELYDMLDFGRHTLEPFVSAEHRNESKSWLDLLDHCLANCGDLDGSREPEVHEIAPLFSTRPFVYDSKPARDQRFPDPYNMGVNAEVFLYDDQYPPEPKTLMMFYKRLREIDVPEMMASIIMETEDKPWKYYQDMTRQLWDEARHAMMGEVGFVNLGIDWPEHVMINFTWSLALNTQLKPLERHAVLYYIEQGLMPKTGKRFEWEIGQASGNELSALFQDYDWADEVLHAKIGRDWYLKEFDNPQDGVRFGDECWSKVLMGWSSWKEEGLTQHHNWWPDLYTEACRQTGKTPDPKVLNFATSYEEVRADLKNLTGSA